MKLRILKSLIIVSVFTCCNAPEKVDENAKSPAEKNEKKR